MKITLRISKIWNDYKQYNIYYFQFYFLNVCERAEANNPVGTATIPIPIKTIIVVKSLPPTVIGYMSPYPTVVSVVTAHHKEWKTDLNASGCTGFSK